MVLAAVVVECVAFTGVGENTEAYILCFFFLSPRKRGEEKRRRGVGGGRGLACQTSSPVPRSIGCTVSLVSV
jgi:hypothetical protein